LYNSKRNSKQGRCKRRNEIILDPKLAAPKLLAHPHLNPLATLPWATPIFHLKVTSNSRQKIQVPGWYIKMSMQEQLWFSLSVSRLSGRIAKNKEEEEEEEEEEDLPTFI